MTNKHNIIRYFDRRFYAVLNPSLKDPDLQHFLREGDAAGLDPNPYFSTSWYKETYPDWRRSGATTALEDFLIRLGSNSSRQPHPFIDLDFLCQSYPDLNPLGPHTYNHFITHGDSWFRQPSAQFEPRFYHDCYTLHHGQKPFEHFSSFGRAQGCQSKFVAHSAETSTRLIRALFAGNDEQIILAVHDTFEGGVPILTLDRAREIRSRGRLPVFIVERGGALLGRFRELGPVIVLKEGWNIEGVAAGLPARAQVIVNTAAAAWMVPAICRKQQRSVVIVSEVLDYLRDNDLVSKLVAAKTAGARIIVPTSDIGEALRESLGDVSIMLPALKVPETSLAEFRKVSKTLRGEYRNPDQLIFVGAGGYGTHRKGFDRYISAARRIRRLRPDARFVWLGILDAEGLDLASEARSEGLDIVLPGFVDNALAWYHAADAYLSTTRAEIGPVTALHAALMKTPVVMYRSDIAVISNMEREFTVIEEEDEAGFVDAAIAATSTRVSRLQRNRLQRLFPVSNFSAYVDFVIDGKAKAGNWPHRGGCVGLL